MPNLQTSPRYQVGDQVRVKVGEGPIGTVTEVRGLDFPNGRIFYRVRVPMDAEPLWFEVFDDEIEKA